MEQIMGNWRDVAAAAANRQAEPAKARHTYDLPTDVVTGLRLLDRMQAPPGLENPASWRPVVADALRLSNEGWATQALELGWSRHDLFGVGPTDDWEFSGLAVWLAGRTIVTLDGACAVAASGHGFGSIFIRGGMGHGTHPTVTPVLLWEFAR
jgi:hypothetical protein